MIGWVTLIICDWCIFILAVLVSCAVDWLLVYSPVFSFNFSWVVRQTIRLRYLSGKAALGTSKNASVVVLEKMLSVLFFLTPSIASFPKQFVEPLTSPQSTQYVQETAQRAVTEQVTSCLKFLLELHWQQRLSPVLFRSLLLVFLSHSWHYYPPSPPQPSHQHYLSLFFLSMILDRNILFSNFIDPKLLSGRIRE